MRLLSRAVTAAIVCRCILGGLAIAAVVAAPPPADAAPSAGTGATGAPPGPGLLAAAEQARITAVGRIAAVTRLDRSGYGATLIVERILRGTANPMVPLHIGWEELAAGRPVRFANGQRVVVALDPPPAGSLWRQRFPSGGGLAIAAHGAAVLAEPSPRDVDLLAGYLELPGATAPGTRGAALARVVVEGSPPLARAALERLRADDVALDQPSAPALIAFAADDQQPRAAREIALGLLGSSRLPPIAAQLEPLARPGAPLEPQALIAIGTLQGGLPAERVAALLDRSEASPRAVGARFATGTLAERRLPPLVIGDPDPSVRAAAATTLAASHTRWGLDGALPALGDASPQVRSAAAQALARLGEPVVPTLEDVARSNPKEARGAMAALALAGPAGVAALRRIASDHPDPRMRDFARLALGAGPPAH